ESEDGILSREDINGRACSIELYLGVDVLTDSEGALRPVQWKSLVPSMNRRQGEIVGKELVQKAFRAKYSQAQRDPETVRNQDWTGLRLILDEICTVASRLSITP